MGTYDKTSTPIQGAQHAQPVGDAPYAVPMARQVDAADQSDIRVGKWDAHLCGCFKHVVPNCCMATFCPCVSVAQISERLGIMSYCSALLLYLVLVVVAWVMRSLALYETGWTCDEDEGDDCGFTYQIYYWLSLATYVAMFAFVWHLRTATRARFELPGSCCSDFFYTLCCTCCSIAQIATHVKSYKPGSCDFGPPDTLPAYPYDSTPRNYV